MGSEKNSLKARLGSFGNPFSVERLEDLQGIKFGNFVSINGKIELLDEPSFHMDVAIVEHFGGYFTISRGDINVIHKHYIKENGLHPRSIGIYNKFRDFLHHSFYSPILNDAMEKNAN